MYVCVRVCVCVCVCVRACACVLETPTVAGPKTDVNSVTLTGVNMDKGVYMLSYCSKATVGFYWE